jgi:hypothetical protein
LDARRKKVTKTVHWRPPFVFTWSMTQKVTSIFLPSRLAISSTAHFTTRTHHCRLCHEKGFWTVVPEQTFSLRK